MLASLPHIATDTRFSNYTSHIEPSNLTKNVENYFEFIGLNVLKKVTVWNGPWSGFIAEITFDITVNFMRASEQSYSCPRD